MNNENENVENQEEPNSLHGNTFGRKRKNKQPFAVKAAKATLSALAKVVTFLILHPWVLIALLGVSGIAALLMAVGQLSSDHSMDETDKSMNSSINYITDTITFGVNNATKFNNSKHKNSKEVNGVLLATTNLSSSFLIATSPSDASTDSVDDSTDIKIISDEAKALYNEKGSLVLLSLSGINKLYEDYIHSDQVTSQELELMKLKMGTEAPGSHDDEILKNGSITPSGIAGGGGDFNGSVVKNGQLVAFDTRNPDNKNSPNSLTLTDEQMKTFEEYLSKNTTIQRKNMVLKALSAVGKVYYSQAYKNPYADMPSYLDCSSFVYWAYIKSGLGQYTGDYTTRTIVNALPAISYEELQPGDLMLKNAGGQHVIMFIGWTTDGRALTVECDNFTNHSIVSPQNGAQVGNVVVGVRDLVLDGEGNPQSYFAYCRRWPEL